MTNKCATNKCKGEPTTRIEVDVVGSTYCNKCFDKLIEQGIHGRSVNITSLKPYIRKKPT